MKHHSVITCLNQSELLDLQGKDDFSEKIGHKVNILSPRPLNENP